MKTRSGVNACDVRVQAACHWTPSIGRLRGPRQVAVHALLRHERQAPCTDLELSGAAPELPCQRRAIILSPLWAAAWSCLAMQPAMALESTDWAQGVAHLIESDFVEKQYYVTGNLSRELYQPNCRFVDPTTDIAGVEPYTKAVSVLFDPATSKAELISIKVTSPTTIVLRWRLEGALRLGNLKIKPYTGTTVYTLNSDTGLIESHIETWDISAVDAFLSTVLPNTGAPPAPPIEQLRAEAQRA